MNNQRSEEMEIDILELVMVLRSRWLSMLMSGVILAAVFGLGTLFLIEPKYQSTSKLYIVSQTSAITSLTDLQAGSQLTQDYIVLVQSRPVLEKVIENLNLHMEYQELLGMLTLSNPSDTRILEVTVTMNDPYMAKEIVDEISDVSITRIARIMNADEPTMVEYGHLENSPSSPDMKKNILIGGLAGIFVSGLMGVGMYLLNDTIRTEEDIQKYLGLNTLGMIPIEEGSVEQMMRDRRKRKKGNFKSLLKRTIRKNGEDNGKSRI